MTFAPYPQQWCGQSQPHAQHTWVRPDNMYANCSGHSGQATIDPKRSGGMVTVDGMKDPCPTPGYAGRHTAVGAGAVSSPYRCHGCGAWFTLPETSPIRSGESD